MSEAGALHLHDGEATETPLKAGRRPWSPVRSGVVLVILPLLAILFIFVLPMLWVVAQSFAAKGGMLIPYERIASDRSLRFPLIYTFETAALVTVWSLVLSYPVAFLISQARGKVFNLGIAFVLVPFWTSVVVRSYAWLVILQRHGILNELLMFLGLIRHPIRLANTDAGTDVAMIHIMLPFMILPLLSSMRAIDASLLRAAAILGASPWHQFVRVYLPLTLPGIGAGSVLVFISTLGFYITPALLGGSSTMIAVAIDQQVSQLLDWPTASALATVLLLLTCGLFLIYERIARRATEI